MGKLKANVVLNALGVIIGIISIICYAVTATDGMSSPSIIYVMLVFALVMQAGAIFLNLQNKFEYVRDILNWGALLLYMICIPVFLSAREQQISLLLNSMFDLAAPITVSWIMTVAGMFLASAMQVASAFVKD